MHILESPYFWSSYWEYTSFHEPWPCFIWWLSIYHPQKYLHFLLSYRTKIKFLFESRSVLTFCIFHGARLNSMIQISPLPIISKGSSSTRRNFLKSPLMYFSMNSWFAAQGDQLHSEFNDWRLPLKWKNKIKRIALAHASSQVSHSSKHMLLRPQNDGAVCPRKSVVDKCYTFGPFVHFC